MVEKIYRLHELEKRLLALTNRQALWLQEEGIADVSPSPQEGYFSVSIKQVAGQVSFDGTTFSIAPKLPVRSVVWMLQQAYVPINWKGENTPLHQESLICAMAQMYRALVERVLAGGLLQGYVPVQERSSVVRGRLLLNKQLNHHFGNLYPFETSYQKFGVNVPVNQVVLTAAVHLMHLLEQDGRFSDEVLAYRRFLQRFEGVQPLVPGQGVPEVVFNRLNQRYEQVFRWAVMILRQIGFSAADGLHEGSGFVVNMASVFEAMVGNILVSHYPAGTVQLQRQETFARAQGEGFRDKISRLDVVRLSEGRVCEVLDTKYRRDEVKMEELYQLNAYGDMFGLDEVSLVYGQRVEEMAFEVSSGRRVRVRGIDLTVEPEGIKAQVCRLFSDDETQR